MILSSRDQGKEVFSFKELCLTAAFGKLLSINLSFFSNYMLPEIACPKVKYGQERLAPQLLARGNH